MNKILLVGNPVESVIEFIVVLIIFIFVLGLTYFTTRWIANFQQTQIGQQNIKPIETYKVTNNKYLQIVKIGEKYIVISICKDTITMLTELSKEDITEFPTKKVVPEESFKSILEKVKKFKPGSRQDD